MAKWDIQRVLDGNRQYESIESSVSTLLHRKGFMLSLMRSNAFFAQHIYYEPTESHLTNILFGHSCGAGVGKLHPAHLKFYFYIGMCVYVANHNISQTISEWFKKLLKCRDGLLPAERQLDTFLLFCGQHDQHLKAVVTWDRHQDNLGSKLYNSWVRNCPALLLVFHVHWYLLNTTKWCKKFTPFFSWG
jgi:hypothetical protein